MDVVVLGAVVTTLSRPVPGAVVVTPGYAVRKPYAVRRNRWYQQDAYGDCFEVRLQGDGQQVWTQVHPSQCY